MDASVMGRGLEQEVRIGGWGEGGTGWPQEPLQVGALVHGQGLGVADPVAERGLRLEA